MNRSPKLTLVGSLRRPPLRVGFMPLTDSAPIVMAHELGCFAQYDLDVQLCRERAWSVLLDKFVEGDLDAIQAPASFPLTVPLGLYTEPCACLTGLILNLQGNAITLSTALREQGVSDLASLCRYILRSRDRWHKKPIFGVPHAASTHSVLLRRWLSSGGIDPDRDIRMLVVSPMEMYPHLKLGHLDGYCVGEPWNSVALESGVGFCVATSATIAPLHPEKVLLVRREFAERRAGEHLRLLAAVLEGCRFCDVPKNWSMVRSVLTHMHYVNAPEDCLLTDDAPVPDVFHSLAIFHRNHANAPTRERAQWMFHELADFSVLPEMDARSREGLLANYRNDYFSQALSLAAATSTSPDELLTERTNFSAVL